MSTGLELLPLALAIGAAVGAMRRNRAGPAPVLTVTTRLRDDALLVQALETVGGHFGVDDGVHHGRIGDVPVAVSRNPDGQFDVHLDPGVATDQAEGLVAMLDQSYGRQVQQQVYEKLLARAPEHGLAWRSERVEEDDAIVVTLTVEEEVRA